MEVVVVVILVTGVNIFINGMYLFGLPERSEVQSVTISYPAVTDEVKEVSTEEDVELALKLTGFLKYDLFEKTDGEGEALITMTYHLKDGSEKEIAANHEIVWWNGKAYCIKDQEKFIRLTEGIFFLGEVQEQ